MCLNYIFHLTSWPLVAKPPFLDNNIHMKSSEAFLLRKIEYGEADYIVSLFTRDFGKIRGIAKNAKKSRRRFGGRLEPFIHLRVRFREKPGGMRFIEDAETIRAFSGLMKDVEPFMWGSFILENVDVLLPEEEPNGDIFELLVHTLSALDSGKSPIPSTLGFQLSLLSLSGYKPNLYNCVRCGKPIERGFFSIEKGGFFCNECKGDRANGSVVSSKDLNTGKDPIDEANVEAALEYIRLLSKFTEYHTGKEIRSYKLLEELRK